MVYLSMKWAYDKNWTGSGQSEMSHSVFPERRASVILLQFLQEAARNSAMESVGAYRGVEQPAHDLSGLRIVATDLACELRALLFGHAVHVSTVHPLTTACTLEQRSAKSSLKV
jgi:hypothetical protein